jgi:hypothetical protein
MACLYSSLLRAEAMGLIRFFALAVNVASVLLLLPGHSSLEFAARFKNPEPHRSAMSV